MNAIPLSVEGAGRSRSGDGGGGGVPPLSGALRGPGLRRHNPLPGGTCGGPPAGPGAGRSAAPSRKGGSSSGVESRVNERPSPPVTGRGPAAAAMHGEGGTPPLTPTSPPRHRALHKAIAFRGGVVGERGGEAAARLAAPAGRGSRTSWANPRASTAVGGGPIGVRLNPDPPKQQPGGTHGTEAGPPGRWGPPGDPSRKEHGRAAPLRSGPGWPPPPGAQPGQSPAWRSRAFHGEAS